MRNNRSIALILIIALLVSFAVASTGVYASFVGGQAASSSDEAFRVPAGWSRYGHSASGVRDFNSFGDSGYSNIASLQSASVSLNLQISSGSDDAEEFPSGTMYLTSSDLELMFDSNHGTQSWVGMRWTGAAIPTGATITNAHITFTVDETGSSPLDLNFYAEGSDNTQTFSSTANDISSRAKTISFVTWTNVPSWTSVGDTHQTPDLSSVIQEVVNRPGWVQGNSLAILVTSGSSSVGPRTAESYNGIPGAAPLLHIEYLEGSDLTPPIRSNGQPTGMLPAGTVTTSLSLDTDENATCRYAQIPDQAYSGMTNTFATTGGVIHSTTVSGLINGDTYNYYIKCQDTAANINPDDYSITFYVRLEGSSQTPPNFKVAFIGDQDLTVGAKDVLTLIFDEGADMVLHSGDFDYADDPSLWDQQINDVLGPSFPYFASIGNHDVLAWPGYEQKLLDRLALIPGAVCVGDYGVKAVCTYQGLTFILTGPGTVGSGYTTYIKDQLAQSDSIWEICSWHKSMNAMQVGVKIDKVGWGPYEECRKGGAIIATAHNHSYARTKTLSSTQLQTVDPLWSDPNMLRVSNGSTFAFVSGLGGRSIDNQVRCLPSTPPYGCNGEWATIYTADQGANYGALFIEFNVDGDPAKASGYFKNIGGEIIDSFTIFANPNTLPEAPTGLSATLVSSSEVTLDWNDNSEIDLEGYSVYRSTISGGSYTKITSSTVVSSIYTDTGLTSGVTYYYLVTAVDTGGNESGASNEASFTATDPSEVGEWSGPLVLPAVAVHMALLHTGAVLMWDGGHNVWHWNPETGLFSAVATGSSNIFCSGHVTLADGKTLVVGGHSADFNGIKDAIIFDPVTKSWTPGAQMQTPRWYPTATTLQDGRVLTVSGAIDGKTQIADIPEIYDPVTDTWSELNNAQLTMPLYPFMFLIPDGRVLFAGSDETSTITQALDLSTQSWTTVDPVPVPGGSAAMYSPGLILKAGSPTRPDFDPTVPALDTAYVLDMNQASPGWRQVGSMELPRAYHTLTLLADGSVITMGGLQTTDEQSTQGAFTPEIWDPQTENWTTMAEGSVVRSYHTTSLLLPDGRVLEAGSGYGAGLPNEYNAQIFSPPYLFKGSRPTITSAPETINYGSQFFIETPDAASIVSNTLVRPGAVTHAFDQDQRSVPLSFVESANGLTIQAPANGNLAPPGYYMLFIVNADGVPSIAKFVRLEAEAANVALGITDITNSSPTHGASPLAITDGVTTTDGWVGLNPGPQWVQLDLGGQYDISRVNVRHYYGGSRTYRDVIIQLSADRSSWVTIFNNDADNSTGQGVGSDGEYGETAAGLDVSLASLIRARYVRSWSNGSNANGYNHYVELEVYGVSAAGAVATNQAPIVDAGVDLEITLPSSATLAGTASDDGLPSGALTTTWSKTSGPGTVTFGDASLLDTTATFSVDGIYVLRLTADDSQLSAFDEVAITVNEEPPQTITNVALGITDINTSSLTHGASPSAITDGATTTDGWVGLNPGPQWVQLDLGGQYDISRVNVRHYYGGPRTYRDVVLQLSTDGASWVTIFNNDADNSTGQGVGSDGEYGETAAGLDVSLASPIQARYVRSWINGSNANGYNHYVELEAYGVTADGGPTNQAPIVNAGANQEVTRPSSAALVGTVSDDGLPGGGLTTTWSMTSGPGTVTFGDASLVDTTATFSVGGIYVLRLTANDGELSAFDETTITVNDPNVALGVTDITTSSPTHGAPLSAVTDGITTTDGWVGLNPGPQWVQLDLGGQYDISWVNVRHYYGDPRTYRDVVLQLSTDGASWVTIFNNDADDSSGQGAGSDGEYGETPAGLDILLTSPIQARYVRSWSNGSNANGYNHYVELEAYGATVP